MLMLPRMRKQAKKRGKRGEEIWVIA